MFFSAGFRTFDPGITEQDNKSECHYTAVCKRLDITGFSMFQVQCFLWSLTRITLNLLEGEPDVSHTFKNLPKNKMQITANKVPAAKHAEKTVEKGK